jgi:hypothetical protein
MTLAADEFIRRFLLHVLPAGFQRIRHFGFLANCHRQDKLALCRKLLAAPLADLLPRPADYRDFYQVLTQQSLLICPQCGIGAMLIIQILPSCRWSASPPLDSS